MSPLPSRVLRPSPLKTAGLAALTAAMAAGGAWMIVSGEVLGWFVAVFFGLCTLVIAAALLPNASYLRVGPDGFTLCSLFRAHSYRWSDVSGFSVDRVGPNRMVVFDFSEEFQGMPRLRRFAAALGGHEGGLPDSYGMPLEDLAGLLNEYREQGIASGPARAPDEAGRNGGRVDGQE
jgi:hypothetical protein